MKKLILLALLLPTMLLAQNGMHFEHNLTWKEVQEKAKKENKYIFVDAYTTWCGPCKYMAAKIFPEQTVGDFYNASYINVKYQLDTTGADKEEIKKLYADAHFIAENYKVNVYPTYLFFSPDGKLVHRAIGSSPAEAFIAKGKDALNPETQYYTQLEKFNAGNRDSAFLRKLSFAALYMYDDENTAKVSDAYLATQPDLYSKGTLSFINQFTQSSKSKGFAVIRDNAAKYDAQFGAGEANKKLVSIILKDETRTLRSKAPIDWDKFSRRITSEYPAQADQVIATAKVTYYKARKDWDNFQKVIIPYMAKYSSGLTAMDLNNYAWTVFENCKDGTCLAEAINWSKTSLKGGDSPMFLDTYANLLYRSGKKEEAIAAEEKALGLADADEKAEYQGTLDKMKKGEKTWNF